MATKSNKAWREIFLEAEREKEKLEYKSIIDRPYLTPLEIWTITERNFMLWRRKHDYPRILDYFSENLEGFEDWKKAYAINNAFLMSYGICNCISLHTKSKSEKYIIEEEWNGQKSRTLSLQNLHNRNSQMGPYPVTRKAIKSFLGFLDWAESKKLKVHKEFRNREFLRGGTGKTAPGTPDVEVTVLDRMPLLKIGGLRVPTNQFGIINTKYFELVNADCLELEGRLSTKSRVLVFESSSLDNLYCEKMDLSLVRVSNCSVEDANIVDSNIQQWEFTRSRVTGKLVNSDFALSTVFGGQFYLDFKGSTINRSEARASRKTEISFEQTYRNFKQLYANQGEDAKAVEYFLLEKQILRLRLLGELLKPQIGFNYNVNAFFRMFVKMKYRTRTCLRLLGSVTNHLFWGYGRRPLRIIPNALIMIAICATIIFFNRELIGATGCVDFTDSLYYSTMTFITIGTNDFNPQGSLKILVIVEALLGIACLGFLIGGLSNSKY